MWNVGFRAAVPESPRTPMGLNRHPVGRPATGITRGDLGIAPMQGPCRREAAKQSENKLALDAASASAGGLNR